MPGERLLRKDAGDRDAITCSAGSLHLRFFVPQLGQLLRSDRAKVKDIKVQQHRAMRQALRQRQHCVEAAWQREIGAASPTCGPGIKTSSSLLASGLPAW